MNTDEQIIEQLPFHRRVLFTLRDKENYKKLIGISAGMFCGVKLLICVSASGVARSKGRGCISIVY